jgi:hypothetical protein
MHLANLSKHTEPQPNDHAPLVKYTDRFAIVLRQNYRALFQLHEWLLEQRALLFGISNDDENQTQGCLTLQLPAIAAAWLGLTLGRGRTEDVSRVHQQEARRECRVPAG